MDGGMDLQSSGASARHFAANLLANPRAELHAA
jgi:hypothetical protein